MGATERPVLRQQQSCCITADGSRDFQLGSFYVARWSRIDSAKLAVVDSAIRPEVAIAVSRIVRSLDIFLSFAVWGIGLSMMGAYRNGAFAHVTLVTIRRFARAHHSFKLHPNNGRQIVAIRSFDIARRHNVALGLPRPQCRAA